MKTHTKPSFLEIKAAPKAGLPALEQPPLINN
jgi:hypothetical protein